MKVILKIKNKDRALVVWVGNNLPFVVCTLPLDCEKAKPGDTISVWFHGNYFATLDEALAYFNRG